MSKLTFDCFNKKIFIKASLEKLFWCCWLANLKAYLEHGILLNETEFDPRDIPLSGFEFVNM